MIRAASTCPKCLEQVLALDPQPGRAPRRHERSGSNYIFSCRCGAGWMVGKEESELTYRWLERSNLLAPAEPLVQKSNERSGHYTKHGKMSEYVLPRTRRVISQLFS